MGFSHVGSQNTLHRTNLGIKQHNRGTIDRLGHLDIQSSHACLLTTRPQSSLADSLWIKMMLPASVEDIDWPGNSVTTIKLSEKLKLQNGQKMSESNMLSSPYVCTQSYHGQCGSQWNREALATMNRWVGRGWSIQKRLGFETLTFQRDPVPLQVRSLRQDVLG